MFYHRNFGRRDWNFGKGLPNREILELSEKKVNVEMTAGIVEWKDILSRPHLFGYGPRDRI